jgi:hypothetical protein
MAPDQDPVADDLAWATRREAVALIGRGATFRTASRISLVVGSLLTVVNQAGVLVNGDQTTLTWVRIGFNYAIPYVVASLGFLAPFRRKQH